MMFQTKREILYQAFGKKSFHFVTYLKGEHVATGPTKAAAEAKAAEVLLGAYHMQGSTIYASVTADGHIVTSQEYTPGEASFTHHRAKDGRGESTMMSQLKDRNGYSMTLKEFHEYNLESYNEAVRPAAVELDGLLVIGREYDPKDELKREAWE